MTPTVCKQLTFVPTPLASINMQLVGYYVEQYKSGNQYLPASAVAVAKAAIALQEAYARKEYHVSTAVVDDDSERELDEKMYNRVLDSIKNMACAPSKGVMWGVARTQLPQSTNPGEYATIRYKFLNEIATAAGLIISEHHFVNGKGVIIRLMETNNSFNISTGGWRYVALWIPAEKTGMAGFLSLY